MNLGEKNNYYYGKNVDKCSINTRGIYRGKKMKFKPYTRLNKNNIGIHFAKGCLYVCGKESDAV